MAAWSTARCRIGLRASAGAVNVRSFGLLKGRLTLCVLRWADNPTNSVTTRNYGRSMQNARIKKGVPPYTPPGKLDLFDINSILATLWREPDDSRPRLGNPEDPLDDLIYLMLTRRGQIRQAQQLFETLRRNLISRGQTKPDWSAFLNQGVEAMARCFTPHPHDAGRAGTPHQSSPRGISSPLDQNDDWNRSSVPARFRRVRAGDQGAHCRPWT